MRAVTPDPVGLRSTSASANTQTLAEGPCSGRSRPSVRMLPYKKPRSGSSGWTIFIRAFTAAVSRLAASTRSRVRLVRTSRPKAEASARA